MAELILTGGLLIDGATARVCGLPDHGILAADKADLLVVYGDPLGSLEALVRTWLVIHGGEVIRQPSSGSVPA